MIISVINHTNGLLSDAMVQRAIRAINRQIAEDFEPQWNMSATLRLEGHMLGLRRSVPGSSMQHAIDMRGDAVVYLWHPMDVRVALGYHERNFAGIPFGYVFPALSESINEPWTVTLSHEALELVADPDVNLLVMGPHPVDARHTVFHWYEVCDAVQQQFYMMDGLAVSNFVLPKYFTSEREPGSRNDFLGLRYGRRTLPSFGVSPGGYIGFFDPATGKHEVYFAEGDEVSLQRLVTKGSAGRARRASRYLSATGQTEPVIESGDF